MDFYLMSPDTTFHFPVNPEEMVVSGEKQTETIDLLNIGEVDFPQNELRAELRFSSFFPAVYDDYCRYVEIPDPQEAIQQLLTWRDEGKPVRLIVTDLPINTLVLVKKVDYRAVGGEVGDIYFDLLLRTWREVKIRTSPEAPAASRPDTKPIPKVYTVRTGDSLYRIAKMELGSGSKWKSIYDLNAKAIGPDPNKLVPGTKLIMPA